MPLFSLPRLVSTVFVFAFIGPAFAQEEISFNRDIRPILTDHCFACHGPDSASVAADLRLDLRDVAIENAIVPGNAKDSVLIKRISSSDDDTVMPPAEHHKPLSEHQKSMLKRWIDGGATYQQHWSYTPLERPALPRKSQQAKNSNPIDAFIARGLVNSKTSPSPRADRVTLIRRLSFDLTGMPPTTGEVRQFTEDQSPDAYRNLVKRLLSSPRYGERMAVYWLDLVRYADTVGYHGDQNVSISPYRDYVIHAFNSNMPYDQFMKEQLAGDLLPSPTQNQIVATGYNRLNQTTEEGGAQPKEYLAIYFADRVRNVSQVFMGATVGCAQCHDHKYDPYTAKDFYSLGAFFADVEERGKYGGRERRPEMPVPSVEERRALKQLSNEIAIQNQTLGNLKSIAPIFVPDWEKQLAPKVDESQTVDHVWVDDKLEVGGTTSGLWKFETEEDTPVHSGSVSRSQTSEGLVQHYFINADKKVTVSEGTRFYTWVYLDADNPPQAIMLQFNAGGQRGNWEHRAVWGNDSITYGRKNESHAGYQRMGGLPNQGQWTRLEVDAADVGLKAGDEVNGVAFTQFGGTVYWDQLGWSESTGLPRNIVQALKTAKADRTVEQDQLLVDASLKDSTSFQKALELLKDLQDKQEQMNQQITTSLITKSVTPRPIRILHRGDWMDESGELVEPAIPEFLGKLDTHGRATRLDLANWLCQSGNVLTSRTMVNRLWYLMFGRGLCNSVDDLGGQGTFPSHPELLDYLAVEFVESGWDIQHLLTLIATSKTYQRSSVASAEIQTQDPYNELFARQGRFRISAEMVRDTSLFHGGLLVEKTGGRSVRPYQPEGYYAQLNFPKRTYSADKGESQYRRGLYTHWQRTFLHPMLKAFDAPSREECTAQRPQSNTPLQALTLLNDPTFLEAARGFAERSVGESEAPSPKHRIAFLYRTAVSREPDKFIQDELKNLYTEQLQYFQTHPERASAFLKVGDSVTDVNPELAALTSVARVILNLRETTTRY